MKEKKFTPKLLQFLLSVAFLCASIDAISQCNVDAEWTFNPPPIDGQYDAGTEVEICVDISNYTDGSQWLHGIVLNFHPSWNLLDYVDITPPSPCGGAGGNWLFMESVTSTSPPFGTYGPGFFYDANSGGPMDGNPGNNWGDFCTIENWSFCITVIVGGSGASGDPLDECGGPGNPDDGAMIMPSIQLTGDNLTGSWGGGGACIFNEDPDEPITLNCCDAESGTSPGTLPICNVTVDLYDELGDPKQLGGIWTAPDGSVHSGVFDPALDDPGVYIYCVLGTDDCEVCTDVDMQFINLGFLPPVVWCGTNATTIQSYYSGAGFTGFPNPGYTTNGGFWTLPNGSQIAGNGPINPATSPEGFYVYTYTNAQNCPVTVSVSVGFASGAGGGAVGASIDICLTDPLLTPLDSLGGVPLVVPGSIWTYWNTAGQFQYTWGVNNPNPNINPGNYNNAGTPNPMISGYMVYIAAQAPCPPEIDTLLVTVFAPANTGEFTEASICITDPPLVLETLMDGLVDSGLNWSDIDDPATTFPGNVINPADYPPNTTLFLQYSGGLGGSTCFSTSLLQLNILPADANAGDFNSITVCETEPPFCMTDELPNAQTGGTWSNSLGVNLGSCFFVPGITPGGTYTYTVTTTCDSDVQNLVISVVNTANAGTDGILDICSNETGIPLLSGLGGTPNPAGSWELAGVSVGNTVDGDAVNDGDVYTYIVGTGTCQSTTEVTINLEPAPFAGTGNPGPHIYCTGDASFSLFTLFDTPPSATSGTWTGPGGFSGNTLNPATAQSGTYTYLLSTVNCGNDTESINILIESAPNAGTNTAVTACPNAASTIDLLFVLGGAAGGTWVTVPAGGSTTGIYSPGDPGGAYVYEISSGSGSCVSSATVNVIVANLPNAGAGGSITVCSGDPLFQLLSQMPTSTPPISTPGTWLGPGGTFFGTHTSQFNPAVGASGNYTYNVLAPGCPPVQAILNVTVIPEPDAGTNNTVTLCENLGNIDLTSYLGGTPEPGVWDVPNPYDISGLGSTTDTFTYTVDDGPCSTSSTLTVNIESLPIAGGDGAVTYCADEPCFNLSNVLVPPFDVTGTWTNSIGAVVANNQCPATLGIGDTFTYTVGNGSCPDATAEVTVSIVPALSSANVAAVCESNQLFYTVTFQILGGTPPYFVNGNPSASLFISAPQAVGTNYSFTITDSGSCGSLAVSGPAPSCNCPASASIVGGNQTICLGGSANITLSLSGNGPFDVSYTAGGVAQPDLLGINDGYVLPVSPAATTNYSLTAVNDLDCTGNASGSVTVIVEDLPNAGPNLSPPALCGGSGTLNLNTLLNPSADTPGIWNPASPVANNSTSSGTYTYTAEGTVCPDNQASYNIVINDQISTNALSANCNTAQTEFTVGFNINGGSGAFTVTGENGGAVIGNVFTSNPIPGGQANYSFTVSDGAGPCPDISVTGPAPNCNCLASASFTGGNITICEGGVATLPVTLAGDGPWEVTYSDGTTTFPPVSLQVGEGIQVSPLFNTTYTLQSVSDANCTGQASGTLTVIVDPIPNAGPDVSEVLCGAPGTLNLQLLIPSGILTNGSFSGPVSGNSVPNNPSSSGVYTYTLDPNSCPADQATYDITIYNPIIVSSVFADCNLAQTEYTVSFSISGGTGNYTVTGGAGTLTGNVFTSGLILAGAGYSYTVADDGPCANLLAEDTQSPDCECLAEGSISGSTSICEGTCADIAISAVGVAPFTIVYQNSNDPSNPTTLNNVFNGQTIQVCPGSDATYTLLSVQDANCNGTVVGNAVNVTVDPPLSFSNIATTCDATGNNYVISFNVTGGVAPYVVSPGVAQVVGGVYTSAPIPSGQGYSFTVADNGACAALPVSGNPFSCPCTTEAGTIQNISLETCVNETVSVTTAIGPVLDGNDVYQYVLHDGDDNTLGAVLVISNDGTFSYNPSLEPGATYYISAIAGNGNAQGNVNVNDACLSVSNGVSVVFNSLPTAVFGGNVTICDGQTANLNVTFTGNGPWSYSFSIGGGTPQGPFTSNGANAILDVNQPGIYVITQVSDASCTGTPGNAATVSTFELPTALIDGDPLVCENSGDGPQVSFSGAAPWTFEYSIDEAVQPFVTTSNNPYTIVAAESGIYELTAVNDANCVGTVGGSIDISYLNAPTAQIVGGGEVCAGDEIPFNVNLTGTAPWTVQYTVDGVPQPAINTSNPNHVFGAGISGAYNVTNVSDQDCSGPGTPGEAVLVVNALPTGDISASDNLLCIGQQLELTFTMQGNPPFDIVYAINGDSIALNGIPNNYTIVLNPIEPVVAELIFAEDGSNPNCAAALSNVAFTQVAELPNAPVLVGDTICSSSGPISIGVASAPGLDYSWSPTSGLSNPNISNPTATLVNANLSPKVFTYTLTASNETCSATDTVNIVVVPAPRARFLMSPDPASTEDPVVFFLNKSIVNDNTTFFWDFAGLGVSTARDPQFRFPQGKPGIYDVTLTTIDQVLGCADEYVDQVTVKRELLIYVPNAFTPDADGKNDIWGPVTTNIDNDQYHLMVFDRTGQLVFETRNVKEKWNGGLMNGDYYLEAGVYVWKIVGKEVDARDEFEMNGIVTMLR